MEKRSPTGTSSMESYVFELDVCLLAESKLADDCDGVACLVFCACDLRCLAALLKRNTAPVTQAMVHRTMINCATVLICSATVSHRIIRATATIHSNTPKNRFNFVSSYLIFLNCATALPRMRISSSSYPAYTSGSQLGLVGCRTSLFLFIVLDFICFVTADGSFINTICRK